MNPVNGSLSQRAVLVTLIVSRYRAKGRSKVVDKKVTDHLKTKRKAGSTQIDLLDPKSIKATQNAAYQISKHYKRYTLPWDERSRILPAALQEKFRLGYEERTNHFLNKADEFVIAYPNLLRKAQDELGDELFSLMEFPLITEIRQKFGVQLSYSPVPVAEDFRVSLSNDELDRIRTELDERNKATIQRSMHDAWRRLHLVVQEMTEKINKPTFRNTMISNITDLANILPDLNLADDQELDGIRVEVLDRLCRYTPEQLRNDDDKRKEVAAAAGQIIGSMRRLRVDL
jgi:hypothetical protein